MIDDPSGSTGLAQRIRRLPISTFLIVLLIHFAIGAWVLSAHFSSAPHAEDSPIYVILEGKGSNQAGQESGEQNKDPHSENKPDSSSDTKSDSPPDLKPETRHASDQASNTEQSETVSVVSISAISSVSSISSTSTASDLKSTNPFASSSVAPSREAQSAAPANSSTQSTASAQAISTGASTASSGPRFVSHIDYLGPAPSPLYPSRAKSRRQEGSVIVRVLVDETGQLRSLSILKSSGVDALDQSALEAVGRTRFKPYSENGIPMDRLADIPIDFVLN